MTLEEMKAGGKGAITSLLFWLVVIYVPVAVIDLPALAGIEMEALADGDPVRIGILGFLWSTLLAAAVFGLIAGVRWERQAVWLHSSGGHRGEMPHPERKPVEPVRPG